MTTAKWLLLADGNEATGLANDLSKNDTHVRLFTRNPTNVVVDDEVEHVISWRPCLEWADYIWCASYSFAPHLDAASEVGDAMVWNWHPTCGIWADRSIELLARAKVPRINYMNGATPAGGTLTGAFNPKWGWSPLFVLKKENEALILDESTEIVAKNLIPFTGMLSKASYLGIFTLQMVYTKQGIYAIDISGHPDNDSLAVLVAASGKTLQTFLAALLRGEMKTLMPNDQIGVRQHA